ncbi:MAG: hypothetical protein K6T77_02590 [candidate division WOR-3 bacterium]|nr:hypothetical protein [candidate division WOR-3 bacterium]MCR4423856.1 hypothetical protein [candidate division WOR-3 bacterium]MDH7519194.1 hypothetical protein [bacterium]
MRLVVVILALMPVAVSAQVDTIIFYDSGISTTWWCSDRDSFGAAVRFTPARYPCEVIGSRAEINYSGGREIYLRVYDDNGPDGKPGTILYNELRLDVPPARTPGFQDYDLTQPVVVDSGDFYIVWWQKNMWDMHFSTDDHFDSISRQWWFFPDMGWVTPMGMDAADHLIRAKVRYGTGVAEFLPSNPAARPLTGSVVKDDGEFLPSNRGVESRLFDATGRMVKRVNSKNRGAGQLIPGVYFIESRSRVRKIVVVR